MQRLSILAVTCIAWQIVTEIHPPPFYWKLCDYFAYIHVIKILQIWPFLLYQKQDFYTYCRPEFLPSLSLYYGFYTLKIMLPIQNKEPPLSETGLPLSRTLPLQFFGIMMHLRSLISTNSHTRHIKPPERKKTINGSWFYQKEKWFLLKDSKYRLSTCCENRWSQSNKMQWDPVASCSHWISGKLNH
jgi:hypothetical protein